MKVSKQKKFNLTVFVGIATILLIAPSASAADIPGDVAEPYGRVDAADLVKMSEWWLVSVCDMFDNCFEADISGPKGIPDGIVNLYDFSVLAAHWMEGT